MSGRRKLKLFGKRKLKVPGWLKRIHPGTVCIVIGVAAIAVAVVIWLYNDFEDRNAAEISREKTEVIMEIIRSNDSANIETGSSESDVNADAPIVYTPNADMPSEGMPDLPADVVSSYVVVQSEAYMGIISIPRFGLNLPVNVTWSYPKLRSTPCRYTGSIERNDLVIAAHSYKSHFGNIHTLINGDTVVFTDVEGRVFEYYVVTVETAKPTDARNVVTSPYDLTLFTCTYDSKARVVVRCNRVEEPTPDDEGAVEEEPEDDGSADGSGEGLQGGAAEEPPEGLPEEPAAAAADAPDDEEETAAGSAEATTDDPVDLPTGPAGEPGDE